MSQNVVIFILVELNSDKDKSDKRADVFRFKTEKSNTTQDILEQGMITEYHGEVLSLNSLCSY